MKRALFLVVCLVAVQAVYGAADVFVASDGRDDQPGTKDRPLATLAAARDAVRAMRKGGGGKLPAGGVTVWIGGGVYELREPLVLGPGDGGTKDAPVVYRARPGEVVRMLGGRRIPAGTFAPVADKAILDRIPAAARGKVLRCDLMKLGLTRRQLGTLSRGALAGGAMLELFCDGKAMGLSRWPNSGWATYGKVIDKGSIPRWQEKPDRPGVIEYTGDRPARWTRAKDIYLHGYYHHDWYDDVLKVAKLDVAHKRITFTTPHTYGLVAGRRYAALNLLEEIDAPGEWMLDRTDGVLYFYPPASDPPASGPPAEPGAIAPASGRGSDRAAGAKAQATVPGGAGPLAGREVVISMLAGPMIRLDRTQHVTIRGLTLEMTRGGAVDISGGTDNVVAGCVIRNIGTGAVSVHPARTRHEGRLRVETGKAIFDGRRNGVVGCDVYEIGTSGISLAGGCRRTLAPGGHYAVNNDVHHYSRRKRTNCPGISLSGVGQRMAHNFLHDAPHTGMFYSGNDHVIEYNEATRLCWETGDVGVFYSGRNWTFRGNVVRHNFIHHIQAPGRHGSMAVYLDDSHSSTAIVGNVFYRVQYAAFIGGGRDNLVANNIFVNCAGAVHLDNRSQGWAHKYQKPGGDHRMYGKLQDVRHDKPPYATRYPKLATILKDKPHEPRGNIVRKNVCVGGRWLHVFRGAEKRPAVLRLENNFVTKTDPGFVDAAGMDFRLRPDSAVWKKVPGFRAIPFAKIGLQLDEYRRTLPAHVPAIHPDGGSFVGKIAVTLSTRRGGGVIRYTLDGREPTPASPKYEHPLTLTADTTVNARTYAPNAEPGRGTDVATATFHKIEFGPGKGVWVSDLTPIESFAHGGLKADRNYRGTGKLSFAGKTCQHGLLMPPEKTAQGGRAWAVYDLSGFAGHATRLRGRACLDDGGDQRGSVVCAVEVRRDGAWKRIWTSDVLRAHPKGKAVEVDADLRGADAVKLIVTDAGDGITADHAAWLEARIE